MRFTISGKNVDVTDRVREMIYDKLEKLDKFFTKETEVIVKLSAEKERRKAEVTIPIKGSLIRAEHVSPDLFISIDTAAENIERQVIKHRKRLIDRHQSGSPLNLLPLNDSDELSDIPEITKFKRFKTIAMDPEDATFEMELLGHNFYVYRNIKTDEINVMYKRQNGSFGLIEVGE
jgi:putative sigma-54 modulation protein